MKHFLFFFSLLMLSSCLDIDELDTSKYNNFIITPNISTPFVQIDLSSDYYSEILNHPDITEIETIMIIDLFKEGYVTDEVVEIEFNFTAINGYPINFDKIALYFIDDAGREIKSIIFKKIKKGDIDVTDGSLKNATIEKMTETFDSDDIEQIMNTTEIKAIISWAGNTQFPSKTHSSYFFKMFSDVVFKTEINIGG
jgi:dihydroorotase